MDGHGFDLLTKRLALLTTRRQGFRTVLAGAGVAGLLGLETEDAAAACGGAGKRCKKGNQCCSGICQGKKPKKGKKDRSVCVAHHEDICTAAHRACTGDPRPNCNPDHPQATCFRTTGQAGYCGLDVIPACIPCRKDTDCHEPLGEGSACVVCSACPEGKGMCVPPGVE